MLPDARKAFEQALNKKIAVPRGDRTVLMTRIEIGFEQLFNQFAKGERHARRDLMEIADKLGIDLSAKYKQTLERARTLQAMRASLLASAIASTLWCSRFLAASIQGPASDWSSCSGPSWISARMRSRYRTGLNRAKWVTSVRKRREDRSSISSHPLADLGG